MKKYLREKYLVLVWVSFILLYSCVSSCKSIGLRPVHRSFWIEAFSRSQRNYSNLPEGKALALHATDSSSVHGTTYHPLSGSRCLKCRASSNFEMAPSQRQRKSAMDNVKELWHILNTTGLQSSAPSWMSQAFSA